MNVPGILKISKTILNKNNFLPSLYYVTFSTKSLPDTTPTITNDLAKQQTSLSSSSSVNSPTDTRNPIIPKNYRFIYPEFLPDPQLKWRNTTREKLERIDMLNRRKHIDIPEFYVGSILAITSSDPHASGKTSRFVGICINRDRCGLRARLILRNVIDHQGMEIQYELYDPTIQKIEVLRLEKRLDDNLFYLRDSLPEYSTFDVNMDAEYLPEGSPIPINNIKVTLKPRPWLERWERQNLKGVSNLYEQLKDKHILSAYQHEQPWEKYDLMKEYRRSIPEEEQNEIYSEVYSQLQQLEITRKKMKRKRTFAKFLNPV